MDSLSNEKKHTCLFVHFKNIDFPEALRISLAEKGGAGQISLRNTALYCYYGTKKVDLTK